MTKLVIIGIRFTRGLPHSDGEGDFTSQVWAALMFQIWHFIYTEQNQTEVPTYDGKLWRDGIERVRCTLTFDFTGTALKRVPDPRGIATMQGIRSESC